MAKHITLANLSSYNTKLQAKIAADLAKKVDVVSGSRLMTDAEGTKLAGIAEGAQVNVIETVKVNGTALTPDSKVVDVTITEGEADGGIVVNGSAVAVHGVADAMGKVTTLVGSDANKSVRTIANEELAAQLIPENAKEALDTLGEIAAWIQAHPDDAAAYNADIAMLKAGLTGFTVAGVDGAHDTVSNIKTYIDTADDKKVDKVEGYGLSKNDFTDALKSKLDGIEEATEDDIAGLFPSES